MWCLKCLFENRPGVSFCEQCGARLSVIAPNEKRCLKCGFVNRPGVKFCEECGAQLSKTEPTENTYISCGSRKW